MHSIRNLDTQQHDTAILLFAHAAGEEVKHKTFSEEHGVGVNKLIAGALLQHAFDISEGSGIPLVPVLSDRQVGSTFGERLANAFQEVFLAGYQRVICIGSDCPTLTTADLMAAQQALQTSKMVVGPATDGGAYLIGLHIDNFDPEAFAMLNWQTGELLQELMLYSYRKQACLDCLGMLAEKGDVDCCADLVEQLQKLPAFHTLRLRLISIIRQHESSGYTLHDSFIRPDSLFAESLELRAPPVI
jgi:hypothetical protein